MQTTPIVSKKTGNQDKAAHAGQKAQGAALADVFLEVIKSQAGKLKQCLIDLHELSLQGRKEFRIQVQKINKEMKNEVNAHKEDTDEEIWKGTQRSAAVRMSEAVVCSRAFDAGFEPEFEGHGYHWIVSQARVFLKSTGNASPTQLRGRKAKDVIEKAEDYLRKLSLNDEQKAILVAFLNEPEQPAEEEKEIRMAA